jgi:hypothetical protein
VKKVKIKLYTNVPSAIMNKNEFVLVDENISDDLSVRDLVHKKLKCQFDDTHIGQTLMFHIPLSR